MDKEHAWGLHRAKLREHTFKEVRKKCKDERIMMNTLQDFTLLKFESHLFPTVAKQVYKFSKLNPANVHLVGTKM